MPALYSFVFSLFSSHKINIHGKAHNEFLMQVDDPFLDSQSYNICFRRKLTFY